MTLMRRLVAKFCIASLALACVTLASAGAQSDLTPLRLVASPVDDVMPVLYAQRAGLFRRAGLNVTVERATNGGATAVAIVSGAGDIGKVNIGAVITAHTHGVKLIIVAPAAVYDPKNPDSFLAVATDSPIRSASDLVGKTVGVPSVNELDVYATRAWMDANHADWKSVQFVEVPFSLMPQAIEQGRVQAATLVKPFTTRAVDSGRVRMLGLDFSAISPDFLESAWVADAVFIDKHKDAVMKFQRVVAQASAYTNAHPSETVDLLASWTGISPDQAAHVPRIVTGIRATAKIVQPVIDAAAKYGWISQPFDAKEVVFGS